MYGISLGSLTFLGSTGNKFFPPAFCQSAKDRDWNVVMPFAPRFFPLFLFFSAFFIFSHCSFDIPEGMYSMVIPAVLETPAATGDPEKDELVEKAFVGDATASKQTAMALVVFMISGVQKARTLPENRG